MTDEQTSVQETPVEDLVQEKLLKLQEIKGAQSNLGDLEGRTRRELQELMEKNNLHESVVPQFNADGTPAKPIAARLQRKSTLSFDQEAAAALLSDDEKAPFMKLSLTATQLEDALKKGDIKADEAREVKLRRTISRMPGALGLVVTIP